MQLTSDEQGMLLAAMMGFVACVALLHLGETTILAARLRAWMPLLWSGILFITAIVLMVWRIGLDVSQGMRFADLLVVFGGQLALLVCLPSRWLSRRTCRWDRKRAQLEMEADWWRRASDPQQQRSRIVFPGPLDHLRPLSQRNHQGSHRAGVGPRTR